MNLKNLSEVEYIGIIIMVQIMINCMECMAILRKHNLHKI